MPPRPACRDADSPRRVDGNPREARVAGQAGLRAHAHPRARHAGRAAGEQQHVVVIVQRLDAQGLVGKRVEVERWSADGPDMWSVNIQIEHIFSRDCTRV